MPETIGFASPYADATTPEGGSNQDPPSQGIEQSVDGGPISFAPPPMTMPDATPVEERPRPPRLLGSTSKTHLIGGQPPAQWQWEQLRDYVVEKIVETHGNFPRDPLKESGIFKGFIRRHGERSGQIAIYAMEASGGWWKNSPIGVERFAKGSDPWFAEEIIAIIDAQSIER